MRTAIAEALPDEAGLADMPPPPSDWRAATTGSSRNPSERWKWDVMYQDLPPVKFADMLTPKPAADVIPLRQVD